MIPAGRAEYRAASIARAASALMADGANYDDALVMACASLPAGEVGEIRAEKLERDLASALAEIAAKDLAPLLPLPYDAYLDAALALLDGNDDDPAYPLLAGLARFEDEADRGQPFVVRGGTVERRTA